MLLSEQPFEAFSGSHGIAVFVLIVLTVWLLRRVRSHPQLSHLKLRIVLAILLIASTFSDIINPLLRFETGAYTLVHENGYPLYLCDIAAYVLAYALLQKNQRFTEIGYVWALAGTLQGLVTPMLVYDWPSIEFITFFTQHGSIPMVAIIAVYGFGWKPERGAFARVWIWTWVFMVTVMLFNFLANTNYSFLNGSPSYPTGIDYLGPYPWYLLSLHGVTFVLYVILMLPYRKRGVFDVKHIAIFGQGCEPDVEPK